ncbi:dTDP-4-dehydrorhamnose 3,5-epimerase [Hyunsoonleella pacifica]|uniref:dTDP-4-dehydrorhamnose 3,5-epimerase n=1 Tax=Hyunsoonleella pacifica TaxID=1080224 RepID=A0A4Q9FPS4_9FLAO|nr:dTDP-4-dehydrorhamnose 3,5-epimerase [Hyunsoonleella pacifica]TBN16729.1 dTDP-4-dehydrorhamnose 3,5-epimerase [Hyunsoonleella pacifica]GGD16941.1 dTDP-4-dehydrorhamnose 3,5-epimerase [Hyunsoonleella pacifica]
MKVEEVYLSGCYVITPNVFEDKRGCFHESFNRKIFKELTGIDVDFVQDNVSQSLKGVLRGLHFQTGIHSQAKLVQVIKGRILDICVDLRHESETFGKHFSIYLDSLERKQLYIPRGFAHGFLVLENNTIVMYKCDNSYAKFAESGIIFNDKALNINWNFPEEKMIISEKDKSLQTFESLFN